MIEPLGLQLRIPASTGKRATLADAEYDTDFFAQYEVDLAISKAKTARAHLAIHCLLGTFLVGLAALAIYVMFSVPQTGDF